jgi:hypothetical protein
MIEWAEVSGISALRLEFDERKWRSTVLESPEGREKYLSGQADLADHRAVRQISFATATTSDQPIRFCAT